MTSISAFDEQSMTAPARREIMPAGQAHGAASAFAPDRIRVQIADARQFAAVLPDWMALAARALTPNVFMDPAVALALAEAWRYPVRVLLAWCEDPAQEAEPALVGVWLFVEGRPRQSWPWRALVSPCCHVAYLGTPVIDPAHIRPVLTAMFEKIRSAPGLPKLLQTGDLSDSPALVEGLKAVLAEAPGGWAPIERRTRARLATRCDPKKFWADSMSERRLQGFARKRRQLGKQGKLAFTSVDDPEAVMAGLEAFFRLEASGWKATRQSALACDPATKLFTTRMVGGLSQRRLVTVQTLSLDGVPVAMWIILHSGSGAFTWRTAYDENYRRFSPGILLLEDTTAHLLSNPAVETTDSCNHRDSGHQAERWAERHDVVDLLIDLGRGGRLRLALLAARERLFRRGKEVARTAYHYARQKKAELASRLHGPRSTGQEAGE